MTQWDEIERLHGLHGAGILTDEEYEREKTKLLSPSLVEDGRLPERRRTRWWIAASAATIVVVVVVCLVANFEHVGRYISASSSNSEGQAVGNTDSISPSDIRVKSPPEAEPTAKSSLSQTSANAGNCHSHAWYYENHGNSFDDHSIFLDWEKGTGWNVQLDPQADGGLPVHERQHLASNSYMLDLSSVMGETGPAQLVCDSDNRHATLITNSGTHVPLDASDAPNLQMAADHSEP